MNDRARQRVFVLRVLVVSLVATLLGRLWYVQVLSGPTYRAAASANDVRTLTTPAPRGAIVDDEGRPLAQDRFSYVVTIDATALSRQPDHGAAVLARLAPVVGESPTDLADRIRFCGSRDAAGAVISQPCYTGSPYAPVPVATVDPGDTAALQRVLVVEERSTDFPDVALSEQEVRGYPLGSVAGQELGYLQAVDAQQLAEPTYQGYRPTDLVGRSGLEEQYDARLRGTDAVRTVSVDATGRVTGTVSQTQPVAGDTLVTNLDAGLQQAVEGELTAAIANARSHGYLGTTASAVVTDVRTGAVLALASLPDYDPNVFTGGISTAAYAALQAPSASNPLISRAFDAAYPPGSTFKASSAAAILQSGLATPSTPTDCPGSYRVGTSTFANFEGETRGTIDLTQALQYSCDTYFYQYAYRAWLADGGLRLSPQTAAAPLRQAFAKTAKAFGYGSPTGIDLPGESPGVIYDRAEVATVATAQQKQACLGAHAHPGDPAREKADATTCAAPAAQARALTAGDAVDFAIGQGGQVLVTPLQQAMAYGAVANGGTIYSPRLAKAFVSPAGAVSVVRPAVKGHLPVSAANLAAIRTGLRAVVTGGTAAGAGFDPQLEVAGKTGTADVAASGVLAHQPESWFVSYQPASAPRYAVVVMVEHAGQGATVAARAVADIYKDMYGLDGHRAVWPGGRQPTALPTFARTGAITAPQRGLPAVHAEPALPGGAPDPVAVANAVAAAVAATRKASAP